MSGSENSLACSCPQLVLQLVRIICGLCDMLEKWVNVVLSRCIFQMDSVCGSTVAWLVCWCVMEWHTWNEWKKGTYKDGAKRNCTLVLTCMLKKVLTAFLLLSTTVDEDLR